MESNEVDQTTYTIMPKEEPYQTNEFDEFETESIAEEGYESPYMSREEHTEIVKTYQNTIYKLIENYETQLKLKDDTNKVLLNELKAMRICMEAAQCNHKEDKSAEAVSLSDLIDPYEDDIDDAGDQYYHTDEPRDMSFDLEDVIESTEGEDGENNVFEESDSADKMSKQDINEYHMSNSMVQGALLSIDIEPRTSSSSAECTVCRKTMSSIKVLRKHMRIVHATTKPFQCPYCDKSFCVSDGLKRHMRVHTGEKPYQCKNCGKCFNQSGNLSIHTRTCQKKMLKRKLASAHILNSEDEPEVESFQKFPRKQRENDVLVKSETVTSDDGDVEIIVKLNTEKKIRRPHKSLKRIKIESSD